MQAIKSVAKKEWIHILRDRRTLTMIVVMPLFQLMMYGFGINNDVKHMKAAVWDQDRTQLSRRLIQAFEQSAYFDFKVAVSNEAEFRKAIDEGDVKAALRIPTGFRRDILAGRPANLQLAIDGSDSTPASTALNTSRAIVQSFMQHERLIPVEILPIDFRPRLWYNPDLKTTFFMIPGLVGLLLQILIPSITAAAIVREKEQGNLEQLLVTPIQPYEIILGKLVPYVCIGAIIAVSILLAARFVFQIPLRGNLITLCASTSLFLIVCLGFGLMASTLSSNQQQAQQTIMLLIPPSIILSGYIFPREGMPFPIYVLSFFIPLTYFVTIIRGIILKGLGLLDLWKQLLPLLGMAVFVIGVSIKKFKKRLP